MDESIIKMIDEKSIKLLNGKYAINYRGEVIILEKVNAYGMGYKTIVSFSFDDLVALMEFYKQKQYE